MRSPRVSSRATAKTLVATNSLVKRVRKQSSSDYPGSLCEHDDVTPLGKRLIELLEFYGWSRREMARNCGLKAESNVERMIASGNCTLENLAKIRRGTRVNLNWLVCGDEDMGLDITVRGQTQAIARRTRRKTTAEPQKRAPMSARTPARKCVP
jgi:transcriptional regulator with XRE-family HTH domain